MTVSTKMAVAGIIAFSAIFGAFAKDYVRDFSGKSGILYWDDNPDLWSGGTVGDTWYPYPEPDAQGNQPNLTFKLGSAACNLYCNERAGARQIPLAFNSVTFENANYYLFSQKWPFEIGTGGMTAEGTFGSFTGTFSLLGSQSWRQKTACSGSTYSGFNGSVAAGSDATWTIAGVSRFVFNGGTCDQYFAKTYSNAGLFLSGTNQFNRFGTQLLTLTSDTVDDLPSCPRLVFYYPTGNNGAVDVNTPLALDFKVQNSQSTYNWIGLACDGSGADMLVNLTQPITGQVGHRQLYLGQTGNHGYFQYYTRYIDIGLFRGDQQRLVFSGDNTGLVPVGSEERKQILVGTIVSAAHQNALGADNAAFDFQFCPGRFNGCSGVLFRGIVGLTARNGAAVGANLTSYPNHSTGANMASGHMFTVLIGTDDGGKSTFSGTYAPVDANDNLAKTFNYAYTPEVRLTAGKGGEARFTGALRLYCLHEVSGLGDVVLANEGNVTSADTKEYGFPVRSGRLVFAADNVATNHQGSAEMIRLGGKVPAKYKVRCMSEVAWLKADLGNAWPVLSNGDDTHVNNVVTFTSAPATLDGVAYGPGDVVLVNTTLSTRGTAVTLNGVWKVSENRNVWQRVDWLDEDEEVWNGHGIRVLVQEGEKFGGRSFFFAPHEEFANKEKEDNYFHFKKTDWLRYLCFHDEAANEPDVGFMAEGPRTIKNDIEVVDNKSSGKSEIGGTTADAATFSGKVSCYKDALTVSAVAGGKVTFTGVVMNMDGVATALTKEGAGIVDLRSAKTLTLDGDITLKGGELEVPSAFVGDKNLTFAWVDDATGKLSVTGDFDLSGRTINFSGFPEELAANAKWTIASAAGTLAGTPTPTGLPAHWSVEKVGNDLVLGYTKPGLMLIFR